MRAVIRPLDVFLLGLLALFFLTAVPLFTSAPRGPNAPPPLFFVLPFVFFLVVVIVPRWLSVWRELSGTSYLVTDRRVVIRSRSREVELDLRTLHHLELERSWISGPTIYFGTRQIYEGWWAFGGSPTPALRGVLDAETVYRTISEARARVR